MMNDLAERVTAPALSPKLNNLTGAASAASVEMAGRPARTPLLQSRKAVLAATQRCVELAAAV